MTLTVLQKPSSFDQFNGPLRVLIDARKVLDGGIGRYIRNLVQGLVSAGAKVSLTGSAQEMEQFWWYSQVSVIEKREPKYSFREMLLFCNGINFSNYDLFHSPHYTLPYFVPIPSIVTVHDLIHLTHPRTIIHAPSAHFLIRSACQRATRVLTVSESSRQAILDRFSTLPHHKKKITVIPNALDPAFSSASNGSDIDGVFPDPSLLRLCSSGQPNQQRRPFLFSLFSQNQPHKGLDLLLEAYQKVLQHPLSNAWPIRPALVIAGQGCAQIDGDERRSISERFGSDVLLIGAIDEQTLTQVYASALALVVPSRAEGFCLPVLEAHSFGTPVIATPVPSVMELLTGFDLLSTDFSSSSFAKAITTLLLKRFDPSSGTFLTGKVEALRQQSNQYSVASITQRVMEIYKEICPSINLAPNHSGGDLAPRAKASGEY